jgi:hypothetical protein
MAELTGLQTFMGEYLMLTTPLRRFAAVSAATGVALVVAQPEGMFFQGVPRPFSAITSETDADIPTTMVPWWLAAVSAGAAVGLFQ